MDCNNNVKKTGIKCPVCGTEQSIYLNVNVHPNSMFNITGCSHIKVSGQSSEKDVLDSLDFNIKELIDFACRYSKENKNTVEMNKEKVFEMLEECWDNSLGTTDTEYLEDLKNAFVYIRKNLK